jgi:hypothetical protein
MKTKAAIDHHGLLTIPVIPAGLTPGEQVEVVLASRGDEVAPLLLLTQVGIEVAIPLCALPEELAGLFQELGINLDTIREVMRKEGYYL